MKQRSCSVPVRFLIVYLVCMCLVLAGCRSATKHRQQADETAYSIIQTKQAEALNKQEPFTIDRPRDMLRRRLLLGQDLAYADKASLGLDQMDPDQHWPDDEYLSVGVNPSASAFVVNPSTPIKISLSQALELGARGSFEYQDRKEQVFRSALDLDLQRNDFRNIFLGQLRSRATNNLNNGAVTTNLRNSGSADVSKKMVSGPELSAALAVDLANLITDGGAEAMGIQGDVSISIPLLRGSAKHVVMESLPQAERDVVYAIYNFDRFKRTFAVSLAREYYAVLRSMDSVVNAQQNYRSRVMAARTSRRKSDAGRVSSIELDQAVQADLSSRRGWISASEAYKRNLDAFKIQLGLPPDAHIELDQGDLDKLRAPADDLINRLKKQTQTVSNQGIDSTVPHADANITLEPPTQEGAGRFELAESRAIDLALNNRLDLRVALGNVEDARRKVAVAADNLRGELTLLGTASAGGSVGTGDSVDRKLNLKDGTYGGLLTLDLPIERTRERNDYRNSLISLEARIRDFQALEDSSKFSIRNQLRTLLESREALKIQAMSVVVSEKREASSQLFMRAGRTEIRNLLEAQDDLLSAKNDLTSALVDYRIAELELQRDLGLLQVHASGMWQEFEPEESDYVTN